jgi:hypothetical protein
MAGQQNVKTLLRNTNELGNVLKDMSKHIDKKALVRAFCELMVEDIVGSKRKGISRKVMNQNAQAQTHVNAPDSTNTEQDAQRIFMKERIDEVIHVLKDREQRVLERARPGIMLGVAIGRRNGTYDPLQKEFTDSIHWVEEKITPASLRKICDIALMLESKPEALRAVLKAITHASIASIDNADFAYDKAINGVYDVVVKYRDDPYAPVGEAPRRPAALVSFGLRYRPVDQDAALLIVAAMLKETFSEMAWCANRGQNPERMCRSLIQEYDRIVDLSAMLDRYEKRIGNDHSQTRHTIVSMFGKLLSRTHDGEALSVLTKLTVALLKKNSYDDIRAIDSAMYKALKDKYMDEAAEAAVKACKTIAAKNSTAAA